MKIIAALLIALSVASTPLLAHGCASCSSSKTAANWPDISHEKLSSLVASKKVVLLDANGSKSYQKSHIPGAIDMSSMSEANLAKALPADKNALIVAYCGGPKCGAWKSAAKKVAALGYTNIAHYSAGIRGWNKAMM